jgi:hypothetical protein
MKQSLKRNMMVPRRSYCVEMFFDIKIIYNNEKEIEKIQVKEIKKIGKIQELIKKEIEKSKEIKKEEKEIKMVEEIKKEIKMVEEIKKEIEKVEEIKKPNEKKKKFTLHKIVKSNKNENMNENLIEKKEKSNEPMIEKKEMKFKKTIISPRNNNNEENIPKKIKVKEVIVEEDEDELNFLKSSMKGKKIIFNQEMDNMIKSETFDFEIIDEKEEEEEKSSLKKKNSFFKKFEIKSNSKKNLKE